MKEIINKVIKLPETPNEYARDMINKYYYTLPNNGSPNVGINSCESRYKEAIECALINIDGITLELSFILNKILLTSNKLEGYIADRIEFYDNIRSEILQTQDMRRNNGGNPDMNNTVTDNNPDVMMSPMDLDNERFFKTEASDYNPSVREKDHPATIEKNNTTGETTIEFPKKHQPEQHNPNHASLETVTFTFIQDANCVDGPSDEIEELIVEAKSSMGIDEDGGSFFVLKTKQWAINDANEMFELMKRCENSINAIVGK